MGVDSTSDAVLRLDIQLGDEVIIIHGGLLDISLGGCVHHVLHHESLDSLVLGTGTGTVVAADVRDTTSVLAVLAAITSLLGHFLSDCAPLNLTTIHPALHYHPHIYAYSTPVSATCKL